MSVSKKQAIELVDAATKYAEERSYLVSVSVVDDAGNEVATVRMDGAKFLSPAIARAKALASAAFRTSSTNVETSAASKTVFYAGVSLIRAGELAIGQGGIPVWQDEQVLGAIGVSGLAPERDEEVAIAALASCGYPDSPTGAAILAAQGLSAPPTVS